MIEAIRAWAARHAAEGRYSPVGQIFHWVMAGLIMFQLYWGWHTSRLPVGGEKLRGYELHAEIGLLMLVLAFLRFLWRLVIPGPKNDADKLGWQTVAAYITHILFYICFFGLPLSGWMMWSALGDGAPLQIAGLIPVPNMPLHSIPAHIQWQILDWMEGIHAVLIVTLVILIPLHIGAALKHHFWDRHDVLRGMLPELPGDAAQEAPRHGLQPPPPPMPSAGG